MNKSETNQGRINELKNKIYYAEIARDNYKNIHPILYETNAYYADSLRQELNELTSSEEL
ncbi:MAG: hypothetical protein D3922_03120 [Candidatus Electrothrix sp. AR1]|nr:hypothetical protein [Candidatus Electrothrix sp. AR1]